MKKPVIALVVGVLVFVVSTSAQGFQSTAEKLDKFIEASMKDWKIPGLSIAVVAEGKVVMAKGYGVRTLG
ncbi:MAG: serine hydrolase, partial [Acidobacteria bacterium]|nr:serine hydrolase [Acidobacteriota bacterium]